jgi:DNA polymerase IV
VQRHVTYTLISLTLGGIASLAWAQVATPPEPSTSPAAAVVGRIPGVGQVTETRMKAVGIATVGDLYALDLSTLEDHFGSYGLRLYQLARGIDHNPVMPNRVSKSISAEDTFPEDIPLADTEPKKSTPG